MYRTKYPIYGITDDELRPRVRMRSLWIAQRLILRSHVARLCGTARHGTVITVLGCRSHCAAVTVPCLRYEYVISIKKRPMTCHAFTYLRKMDAQRMLVLFAHRLSQDSRRRLSQMKQRRQKRVRAIRRRLDTIRRQSTKKMQLVLVLLALISQSVCLSAARELWTLSK